MSTPEAVRIARNRRQNQRRYLLARGEWSPFVDGDVVRAHIADLRQQGVSISRIAELSNTPRGAFTYLMYGGSGFPPGRRMIRETAERILAVQPVWHDIPDTARVLTHGIMRRLQALVTVGWPASFLAAQLRIDMTHLNKILRGERPRISGRRYHDVVALYDELWNVDPVTRGVDKFAKRRAQKRGATQGWAPPAAWDDEAIDHPAAEPNLGEKVPAYVAHVENLRELERQGYTREQIAARLGVTRDTLQRSLTFYRERFGSAA